ncbi:uncharacterized protein si:dkey-245n4.2 [Antennarius striatus]|uniref:uncharacterized protein si:dkey-245n4.2 n=1 Tax=Antennarius striatus TaxID=241820 RepID=UPI0035AFE70C
MNRTLLDIFTLGTIHVLLKSYGGDAWMLLYSSMEGVCEVPPTGTCSCCWIIRSPAHWHLFLLLDHQKPRPLALAPVAGSSEAPPTGTCSCSWIIRAASRRGSQSVTVIAIAMGRGLLCVHMLVIVIFKDVSGLRIQNKLLGKCLQVQEGTNGRRVSLADCTPYSDLQEWHWLPESMAFSSQHSGECLTASGEQYEGVHLKSCILSAESDVTGAGVIEADRGREANSQSWSCSRKGHITLKGRGLHLSATQESTLVFLSREHKQQGGRWQALDNKTLCNGSYSRHQQHQHQPLHHLGKQEPGIFPSATSDVHRQTELFEGVQGVEVTEIYPIMGDPRSPVSTKSPVDPTMIFFTMDYGMGWKITMLVLSSLALVLGTVIIILNVYSNRRKKVVCVLKSYTPRPELNVPGSPVPSERAPLTEHAMRLPHSSPTLQRGEILIEWKDGTVTPLYEA